MLSVGAGRPLDRLRAEAEAGLAAVRPIKFEMAEDIFTGELELTTALRGNVTDRGERQQRRSVGRTLLRG